MGISLCHFGPVASELNLKGKWEIKDNIGKNKTYDLTSGVEYIVSWVES
jgi:hypothetical protein